MKHNNSLDASDYYSAKTWLDYHSEELESPAREAIGWSKKAAGQPSWNNAGPERPLSFIEPLELLKLHDDIDDSLYIIGPEFSETRQSSVGPWVMVAAAGALNALSPNASVIYPHCNEPIAGHRGLPHARTFISYSSPETNPHVTYAALSPRIDELRAVALEEEITVSETSLADLKSLMETCKFREVPSLFLLDNGNIKTAWRHSIDRHASFELLGNGNCKPVILSRGENGIGNHLHGIASLTAIPDLLRAARLDQWLLTA